MTGEFIFLNKNAYTDKNQNYRCYASFADESGRVINFNGVAIPASAYPEPFSVCNLTFDVQQFGNGSTAFILNSCDVIGQLLKK